MVVVYVVLPLMLIDAVLTSLDLPDDGRWLLAVAFYVTVAGSGLLYARHDKTAVAAPKAADEAAEEAQRIRQLPPQLERELRRFLEDRQRAQHEPSLLLKRVSS